MSTAFWKATTASDTSAPIFSSLNFIRAFFFICSTNRTLLSIFCWSQLYSSGLSSKHCSVLSILALLCLLISFIGPEAIFTDSYQKLWYGLSCHVSKPISTRHLTLIPYNKSRQAGPLNTQEKTNNLSISEPWKVKNWQRIKRLYNFIS